MKVIENCQSCGLEVAFEPANREMTLCPRCRRRIVATGARAAEMVTLTPINTMAPGVSEIVLREGVHTLGRRSPKSTAEIQIDCSDMFMSKVHAQLAVTWSGVGLGASVRDLNSSNGTFVNEMRIPSNIDTPLKNGDVLRLGSTGFKVTI